MQGHRSTICFPIMYSQIHRTVSPYSGLSHPHFSLNLLGVRRLETLAFETVLHSSQEPCFRVYTTNEDRPRSFGKVLPHGWICIQLNLHTGVRLIELTFETVLHDFTSEPCFRSYTTSQLDLNPDREFTSIFFLSASVFITLEVLAYSCFPLPYSLFLLSLMW